MQSLDVYKYVNALVRRRRDDLSLEREGTAKFNRTFKGDKIDIHVFASQKECLQILKDTSFVQARIADAITEIFKSLDADVKPIEDFLRNNLIEMNGARHAASRPAFIREYGEVQRRLADELPPLSRRTFEDFINRKTPSIVGDLVEPYVDAMLEVVFNGIGRKHWAGQASCIFEYVHSATKLKKKADQVARFGRQLASKLNGDDAGEDKVAVLPLTYVLQGRDPMIGAMSAFMHSLIATDEDERRLNLETATARDLFWRTSPVNYIGRTATKAGPIGGIQIQPEDQIILLLPWANHDKDSPAKNSLAFGAGAHICPGQTLALVISDAWLNELKRQHVRINWDEIKPDRPMTAVFRQYRSQ